MSKVISHKWYSGRDTVGVVLVEDDITGERKGYIGVAQNAASEEAGVEYIKAWGAKLEPEVTAAIFNLGSAVDTPEKGLSAAISPEEVAKFRNNIDGQGDDSALYYNPEAGDE